MAREKDLIANILTRQSKNQGNFGNSKSDKFIGDDAASVSVNRRLLISVDSSVENVHSLVARNSKKSLFNFGYKSAMTSFSDILAMGSTVKFVLASLVSPPLRGIESIQLGIEAATNEMSALLIGGDFSSGKEICVTIVAVGDDANPILRGNVHDGDYIFVTGEMGLAALGLRILSKEKFIKNSISKNLRDRAVERYLQSRVEKNWGTAIRKAGATSAIDASDGFVLDLYNLIADNEIKIDLEFPFDAEVPRDIVLYGGGDYQIIFSAPDPREVNKAFNNLKINAPFMVGRAFKSSKPDVVLRGKSLPRRGYQHRF